MLSYILPLVLSDLDNVIYAQGFNHYPYAIYVSRLDSSSELQIHPLSYLHGSLGVLKGTSNTAYLIPNSQTSSLNLLSSLINTSKHPVVQARNWEVLLDFSLSLIPNSSLSPSFMDFTSQVIGKLLGSKIYLFPPFKPRLL